MNRPTLLFAIFLFTCLPPAIAQTRADSLRDAGDLRGAIAAYYEAYGEDAANQTTTYNLACALALDKQIDTAFHYLNLAIDGDTSVRALTDPDLLILTGDDRWEEIVTRQVEKVESKYGAYSQLELSRELWAMRMKDQAYYYHIQVAGDQLGHQSPVTKALWDLKHKLNEENLERIIEIIDENGWPKQSIVKGSAASAVFLIIQHADLEVQKKYLPIMKAAADEGEADWGSLALLIDRVNMREGRKQVYGSQIRRDPESGEFTVFDIEDPHFVNKRRKEVGLGPIEEYVGRWGIEWTIEQKE